jgi:hypothetical protein
MHLFDKRPTSLVETIREHMHWPHRQTRAEKALHLVHHALIYCAIFIAGYLVAQVQMALR